MECSLREKLESALRKAEHKLNEATAGIVGYKYVGGPLVADLLQAQIVLTEHLATCSVCGPSTRSCSEIARV